MTAMPLKLQPLTAQAFAPCGNVIEKTVELVQEINHGHTRKYADLAQVDTADAGGRPGVWHHYQITLHETSDYLVIDRAGPGENFEEYRLAQALVIGEFTG